MFTRILLSLLTASLVLASCASSPPLSATRPSTQKQLEALEAELQQHPEDANAWFQWAQASEALELRDKAFTGYLRVLELRSASPELVEASWARLSALTPLASTPKRATLISTALRPEVLITNRELFTLIDAQIPSVQKELLEVAVENRPDLLEAWERLAPLCEKREAFDAWLSLAQLEPTHADAHAHLADLIEHATFPHLAEAGQLYQGHAPELGDIFWRYLLRSVLLEVRSDPDVALDFWSSDRLVQVFQAVYALEMSLARDPIQEELAVDLADAYLALGEHRRGIALLEPLAEAGSTHDSLHHLLALFYWQSGQAQAAQESLLHSESRHSRLFLAEILLLQGECPRALELFMEISTFKHARERIILGRAECLARAGKLDEAYFQLKRRYVYDDPVTITLAKGLVAVKRGRVEQAERDLKNLHDSTAYALLKHQITLGPEAGLPRLYPFEAPLLQVAMGREARVVPTTLESDLSVTDHVVPFELPGLERIDGDLLITRTVAQSSVYLPSLREITGDLIITDNLSLSSVDLPALERVGGTLHVLDTPNLARLELPALTEAKSLSLENNDAMEQLRLPALARLDKLHISGLMALRRIELPRLHHLEALILENNEALRSYDLGHVRDVAQTLISGNILLEQR